MAPTKNEGLDDSKLPSSQLKFKARGLRGTRRLEQKVNDAGRGEGKKTNRHGWPDKHKNDRGGCFNLI